jgi:hypothetical protein
MPRFEASALVCGSSLQGRLNDAFVVGESGGAGCLTTMHGVGLFTGEATRAEHGEGWGDAERGHQGAGDEPLSFDMRYVACLIRIFVSCREIRIGMPGLCFFFF